MVKNGGFRLDENFLNFTLQFVPCQQELLPGWRDGRGGCNKDSLQSVLLYCQQVYKLPRADVLNIIVRLEQGWNSTSGCNNTVGKVTARMFLLAAPAERTVQIISTVVRGLTVKLYQTRENQTKISINGDRMLIVRCGLLHPRIWIILNNFHL